MSFSSEYNKLRNARMGISTTPKSTTQKSTTKKKKKTFAEEYNELKEQREAAENIAPLFSAPTTTVTKPTTDSESGNKPWWENSNEETTEEISPLQQLNNRLNGVTPTDAELEKASKLDKFYEEKAISNATTPFDRLANSPEFGMFKGINNVLGQQNLAVNWDDVKAAGLDVEGIYNATYKQALAERKAYRAEQEKTTGYKFDYTEDDERYAETIATSVAVLALEKHGFTKTDKGFWEQLFQAGSFSDGYDFGDVTKSILGTAGDALIEVTRGFGNMGEGLIDLGMHGTAMVQDWLGFDETAEETREIANQNYINKAADDIKKLLYIEKNSFFGNSADKAASVVGSVLPIVATGGAASAAGAGAVGSTAATTGVIFGSSMGSGISEAYNAGATDGEAWGYGAIKGSVDAVTEMIFGGIAKGANALGISKGISSMDDAFAKAVSSKMTGRFAKNVTEYAIKAGAEGTEEVLAEIGTAWAKSKSYMSEKDMWELIESEDLLESFILGTFASGVTQGGDLVSSVKTDTDFITGLTTNEEAVVEKEVENRITEAEKDGTKLSNKDIGKIREQVEKDLAKGFISTDTIEEVLGGETYNSYKEAVESEEAILKEFEELGNKQNPTLAEQSRYAELKEQVKEIKENSKRTELKTKLSESVFGIASNDRLVESYNERARRGQAFEADLSKYDTKQHKIIQNAINSGILNNTNRTHEFVDMVAKISADKGVSFDFTNNAKLKDSGFAIDGKIVNGYVTKDGITVNMDSAKYVNSVVGHEITHVLEGTELYTEMQNILFEYAKSKGDYQGRFDTLAKLYEGVKDADVTTELTADLVGDYLFTDSDFINKLSIEHRNVFQKIYDEIKYLFKIATAGSKEARQLEQVKRAFDKAYKESGSAKGDTKYSLGYHAGDLGKSEFLNQQGYYRNTGHFGTGTYFVGDKSKLDNYNKRNGKPAPQHSVEFDNYELYKVKNDKDGYDLHEQLRVLDGGISEEWLNPAFNDEFKLFSAVDAYDIAKEKYGDDWYKDVAMQYGFEELAKKHSIEIMSKEEYAESIDADETYEWLDDDYVEYLKETVKEAEEEVNKGYSRFRDAVFSFRLRFGFKGNVENALTEVLKYQKENETVRNGGKDSLATVFMKSLGYEGVDTRGTGLDNTMYGSVIYDLKGEDLARKKEIGTAKYSLTDNEGKNLTKEQNEYFKDSKMRDDNGNLMVMYHGSQDAGFHVFDSSMSDDDTSFFFVDRNDVAASYSGTTETYEAQTIKTAEDMNNFIESIGAEGYEVVEKDGKFTLLYEGDRVADSDTAKGIYEEFCWYEGVGEGDANYKVYLNLKNPLVVDAKGQNWNNISREYSQEIADRYNSLTAEEKAALTDLAEWGEYSIFKDEMLDARAAAEQGVSSGFGDAAFTKTLARAYAKLGGANANLYDAFSIASENFTEESIKQFANKQMNTRDYAKKAKEDGYDGVIFKNIHDNGGYSNGSEGASTVAIAFDSKQIKSVANAKPTANADIRYSLSDSKGRELSAEQQEYFKDSKVVNENGNLKVMYHGTPSEKFTVFKDGTYFTENKWYADLYQNPGASSISTGKVVDAPKTYEVYLNIKKPFDINDAEARKIYINDYIKGGNAVGINPYLSDAEYSKISSIDWTEGEDLRDFLIENGYDYDGLVLDEGAVGGYGDDVKYRGKSYVIFNPEQVKNVDNKTPTFDPDIRYSLSEYTAEEKKAHNKTVLEHFGKTYSWAETGYLLLDGTRLDLSGKHEGAPGGYRTVDHRDITEALGYDYGGGDYSGSLVQFMSEGNIRIIPECNGINLSVKPTAAQEQALSNYISKHRGEMLLDIDDLNGNTVVSVEYPYGTYYTTVLNDIREWFDNGKKPENAGKYSLTKEGETPKKYGNYNIFGKDLQLPLQETVTETENVAPIQEPVVEMVDNSVDNIAPVIDKAENAIEQKAEKAAKPRKRKLSKASLVRFTKNPAFGGGRNLQGAYNLDGKQYISDGVFVAEFDSIDEKLTHNDKFPIEQVRKFLNTALEGQSAEKYSVDFDRIVEINKNNKDKPFISVGGSLYNAKYVEAIMRSLENPTFALSQHRGGHKALVVDGGNGRAMLMPVRAGEKITAAYEAEVINDAPLITEAEANVMQSENIKPITDADAPMEVEAPYYGESENVNPSDPFANRDIKAVGSPKVNAYIVDNPEATPYFQEAANAMLGDLQNTVRGERHPINDADGYIAGWDGTRRQTTDDIAYLLDNYNYTYEQIEKALNSIIEGTGKYNALAKRIEFLLNDRLMKGYKDISGYDIPPNQEYINLLSQQQTADVVTRQGVDAIEHITDNYAPPVDEDIAPMATTEKAAPSVETEDIAPIAKAEEVKDDTKHQTAKILTTEPEIAKEKSRGWSKFKANFLDKGAVFEDLALKTKNRELMGKWNHTLSSESRAQWLIGNGTKGVKSLNNIRTEVEKSGLAEPFYEYMYHKHNVDRMNLESKAAATIEALKPKFAHLKIEQVKAIAAQDITERTTERTAATILEAKKYLNAMEAKNKPVFGYDVTAEISQEIVNQHERKNPKFKEYAQDVYDYMNYLRKQMVDSGVISQETADLWAEMYPHYVPVRRLGDTGLNVNVPLDTRRTGINAPVKRAKGGNRDILPLFDTMAMRTEQTFKAIAKNNFGVELKNTLGSTIENTATNLDEVIDNVDMQDGLLQEGKDGRNPTFTVFENGEKVTFEITEDMYDALKPTGKGLSYTNKLANKVTNIHRGLLTEYNPTFGLTNAIKDAQDILINSQHPARTYANLPKAYMELTTKGKWFTEYMENGGENNTYFDGKTKSFKAEDNAFKKVVGMPLRAMSAMNNFIERAPRLAEYIASRKAGASVEVAMLDAARVTTNFAAGGDVTKFLNRNGATFLNASVQGFNQQVRNIREAKANGLKGWLGLATKIAIAGLPAMLLNSIWDDDEDYENLSDYVKDNYYIVAKFGDGKFLRIPKGRALAVIQDAFEQVQNTLTGDKEADWNNLIDLAFSNLAPNNPIDNNIIAPIMQVKNNETWYGEDLVPTRLQDLPAGEQYDESTDAISKWLGETFGFSPYKINYLLNQYSGGLGDVFLPMLTPEAESGDNSFLGNVIAPLKDKFTTDSTMNNQNVSDFYDTVDELTANAKSSYATDEDTLKYKFINSINSELGELYQQKREIQNSDLADAEKYEAVREIQKQIDALAKNALNTYGNVNIDGNYATVGDRHYRLNKGEWQKITDEQLEKQNEVTSGLGISAADYWGDKDEYDFAYEYPEKYDFFKSIGFSYDEYKELDEDGKRAYSWAYENPEKFTLSKAVASDVITYRKYTSELYDIKADKDENGKSISGSRKEKVLDYINNLDADYGEKIILFKSEYNADDTYNYEIIDYLNSREDISYEEMATILTELGFKVHSDGTITWD